MPIQIKIIFAIYAILSGSLSLASSGSQLDNNIIGAIVDDMTLPHEARPHGVPHRWALQPMIEAGNNATGYYAMTAWGQLYLAEGSQLTSNTRVHIRNIKTCMFNKKDNQWHVIQKSSTVHGAAFREDFFQNISKKANIRNEEQGISVTLEDGFNFHFWPPGRAAIEPSVIAGFITSVEARLINDDPSLPDDRAKAKYTLDMGGDYWLNTSSVWDHFKSNRGIGFGRFRFVKPEWQTYYMSTIREVDLRTNPPRCD